MPGTRWPCARATCSRAGELLADTGADHFRRVVGFDDPAITAAALLGLGEAHYRLNDEASAVAELAGRANLPETPSTYRRGGTSRRRVSATATSTARSTPTAKPIAAPRTRTRPRSPTGSAG